jgi:hypothetical protein
MSVPRRYEIGRDLPGVLEQLRMAPIILGRRVLLRSEHWHEVGAAGEPSLGSGWSHYTDSFPNTSYRLGFFKDTDFKDTGGGFVRLRGAVRGVPPTSDTIFTLPEGYRPEQREFQDCLAYWQVVGAVQLNVSPFMVRIEPSGQVHLPNAGAGEIHYFVLGFDNHRFWVEP